MRKDIKYSSPKNTFLGKLINLLLNRTDAGRFIVNQNESRLRVEKAEAMGLAHRAKEDARYWNATADNLKNVVDSERRMRIINETTIANMQKSEEKYKKDLTNLERTIADQNYMIKRFLEGRMDSASLSAILSNYDSPFKTLCGNLNNVLIFKHERNLPLQMDCMEGTLKIKVRATMPDYEKSRIVNYNRRGLQSMTDNSVRVTDELKRRVVHQMASSLLSKDAFKKYDKNDTHV